MKRIIKFTGRTGRFDVPSFLLTENEDLQLAFESSELRKGKHVVTVKHGKQTKTVYLTKDETIDLTAEWLKEGGEEPLEVFLEFRTLDGSRVIVPSGAENGGYVIEPLQIERVDNSFTAIGWMSKIEEQISAVNDRLNGISARLAEFEDNGVPLFAETETEENIEIGEIEK